MAVDNLIDEMTIRTLEKMATETIEAQYLDDDGPKTEVYYRWEISISANETYNAKGLWTVSFKDLKPFGEGPRGRDTIRPISLGVGGNIMTALFRALDDLKASGGS